MYFPIIKNKPVWLIFLLLVISGCSSGKRSTDLSSLSWNQVVRKSEGTTVTLMMWEGDPQINAYMNHYVVPQMKHKYDIDLKIVPGQGSAIVSVMMSEIQAKQTSGNVDMMWINGQTFYQLKQIKALYGPFVNRLPNAKYIDFSDPFISYDFQQPIGGYECPWGNVQMTIIYDSARVADPPRTMKQLAAYVKKHPGTFTIGTDFTGMTFLKSLLIALAGPKTLYGPFNEQKYKKYSAQLWKYLKSIKPYLWKQGKTFPNSVAQMHRLFASGELNFTMSDNDAEVDNKIRDGLFPKTSRAYVLNSGTIQNSHYMGIAVNSDNKAGAMVVCNFLISPPAQYRKALPKVWGDGSVLDTTKLPASWRSKFEHIPGRKYGPSRKQIQPYALRELAPEYMIRLYADFRKNIIR